MYDLDEEPEINGRTISDDLIYFMILWISYKIFF